MIKTRQRPNRTTSGQLNVRLPEGLLRRVNAVAGAAGKTLTTIVMEALEERTKAHKDDVERMADREKPL
jgi:predicted HicB family RNase H-like nuclease